MKNVIRRCQRPNFKKILWLTMNQQVCTSWLYVFRWNSHNNNSWSFARLHDGYQSRGRSIFEFTNRKSPIAKDGLPYTTLGYINGPGAQINKTRYIYNSTGLKDPNFRWESLILLSSETHGGDDVGRCQK